MKKLIKPISLVCILFAFVCLYAKPVKAVGGWSRVDHVVTDDSVTYHIFVSKTEAWVYQVEIQEGAKVKELNVPRTYKGLPVTTIGYYDMPEDEAGKNLFGRTLDDEQTGAIKEMNFVQKVVLPATLTDIKFACFSGLSSMKTINIPNGVKEIPNMIFNGCYDLEDLQMSKGIYKIHERSFEGCEMLGRVGIEGEVYIEKSMIFSSDKKKLLRVFENATNVKIPGFVKIIEVGALKNTKAKKVTIPAGVQNIEENAFTTKHSIEFKISKKNKIFAVSKGNVYNQKNGQLVVGKIKGGVLRIPSKVRQLTANISLVGRKLEAIVMPKSKVSLKTGWFDSSKYGKKKIELYVPKKYYAKYKKYLKKDMEAKKNCRLMQ